MCLPARMVFMSMHGALHHTMLHPTTATRQKPAVPQPPRHRCLLNILSTPAVSYHSFPPSGPDGPYGRPSSLSGPPPHPAQDLSPVHASYRPINGAPHESSPHSAPPDYRARMGFQPPPEQPTPTESTPTPALPPSSQFMTPAPPVPPGTPGSYEQGYYQNPAYGARQRKAARATQVSFVSMLLLRSTNVRSL
jgi:hypothetical protein